jgi:hypothetical protein
LAASLTDFKPWNLSTYYITGIKGILSSKFCKSLSSKLNIELLYLVRMSNLISNVRRNLLVMSHNCLRSFISWLFFPHFVTQGPENLLMVFNMIEKKTYCLGLRKKKLNRCHLLVWFFFNIPTYVEITHHLYGNLF